MLSTLNEIPTHDHQFVAAFYEGNYIDYMFGPFPDANQAIKWAKCFNKAYAPKGKSQRYDKLIVYPICQSFPIEYDAT